MKQDRKRRRRILRLAEWPPCKCSMFDGPHYHYDAATIISDATFKRAVAAFQAGGEARE